MRLQLLPIELPEDLEYADLVVLSDMHVGDPLFDEQLFFRVRDWVLAEPNRYVICNGDLMNTATKDSVSDVYRETLNPSDQLRWLKKELAALRDRILCITEGNHEARITRATSINVLEQLAESLGLADRYHPEGVLLKITLGRHRKHKKRVCYTIYVTHGRGGGALQGGKALRMARLANIAVADVYIMGHTHWKAAFKEAVYVPDLYNNRVRLVEQTFVNSSALLDWGGYAQVHGYKPSAKGSPYIRLHGTRHEVEVTL